IHIYYLSMLLVINPKFGTFSTFGTFGKRLSAQCHSTVTSHDIRWICMSSTLYTHDVVHAANTLTTAGVATQFLGKVFFSPLHDINDRLLSIFPSLDFADHISGNSFYIRSKVSPYEYWYYSSSPNNPTKAVYASSTQRTRFHVSRTGSGTTCGTVMIGSDEIVITLTTVNLSINVNDSTGQVIVSPAPESGLKFSDLLNRFTVGPPLVENSNMKELLYTQDGEKWELA
ncbi:hypothetical protein EV702DRAFT_1120613, partial [Suillus placidus]